MNCNTFCYKGRVTWYNPVGTKEVFNEEDEEEEEEERNEPDEPQPEVGPPLLTPLAEDESKCRVPTDVQRAEVKTMYAFQGSSGFVRIFANILKALQI